MPDRCPLRASATLLAAVVILATASLGAFGELAGLRQRDADSTSDHPDAERPEQELADQRRETERH